MDENKHDSYVSKHVLVVKGDNGSPLFHFIHSDQIYLESMGEELVGSKKSRYCEFKVIPSGNLYEP